MTALRNLPRDAIRIARFAPAWLRTRGRYVVDGASIELPFGYARYAHTMIESDRYERAERRLIAAHMPTDRPVIELGGSLGIVSGVVRSTLDPDVRMLTLEANPTLIDVCRANAGRQRGGDRAEVLNAALAHGTPSVEFQMGANVHVNRVGGPVKDERTASVPAMALADCLARLGDPVDATLICDIEGAELALFEHEPEALARLGTAIIEIHPPEYPGGEAQFMALVARSGLAIVEREADVLALRRTRGHEPVPA